MILDRETVILDSDGNPPYVLSSSPGYKDHRGLQTLRCRRSMVATQREGAARLPLPDGSTPLWEEGEAPEIPKKVMGLLRFLLKQ